MNRKYPKATNDFTLTNPKTIGPSSPRRKTIRATTVVMAGMTAIDLLGHRDHPVITNGLSQWMESA